MTEYIESCFWAKCCEIRVLKNKVVFLKKINGKFIIRCPACQLKYKQMEKKK